MCVVATRSGCHTRDDDALACLKHGPVKLGRSTSCARVAAAAAPVNACADQINAQCGAADFDGKCPRTRDVNDRDEVEDHREHRYRCPADTCRADKQRGAKVWAQAQTKTSRICIGIRSRRPSTLRSGWREVCSGAAGSVACVSVRSNPLRSAWLRVDGFVHLRCAQQKTGTRKPPRERSCSRVCSIARSVPHRGAAVADNPKLRSGPPLRPAA